jgi:hypothetical protein
MRTYSRSCRVGTAASQDDLIHPSSQWIRSTTSSACCRADLGGERITGRYGITQFHRELGIHLIPCVIRWRPAGTIGIGAGLLDRVGRVAVNTDPERGIGSLSGGAGSRRLGPRPRNISVFGACGGIARPVCAGRVAAMLGETNTWRRVVRQTNDGRGRRLHRRAQRQHNGGNQCHRDHGKRNEIKSEFESFGLVSPLI